MMKQKIRAEIEQFARDYRDRYQTITSWGIPLVGFASASDPMFLKMKSIVSSSHALPRDLLKEAVTVVAFFLPFTKEMAETNVGGRRASRDWAQAYVETNELIRALNLHLKGFLEGRDYRTHIMPATHNFDPEKLISDWSHRHVAFVAGLGRFGVNNMLITDKGCCGRIGTFITRAPAEPDSCRMEEACLYRHNGTCLKCVERCVNGALSQDKFERHKCYEMCLDNEAQFRFLAKADVCGKCLVEVPCSHANPVNGDSDRGR
jgi:epoxyqueuosine reductase QueG